MRAFLLSALIAVLATSCGGPATPSTTSQSTDSHIDVTAPKVTMVMNPQTLREKGNVFFRLSTQDNVAVSRVVLIIDGQTFVDDPTAYNSYAKYFEAGSNGEHTVTVRVYDLAQNVTEQTQNFNVRIGQ
ncbi:Ig-like domain-containing protein [Deinococcus radiotolerans]|uniref:Uncharacterized protein n=1 Tax=Deinococcus radiotolerans TaxID=1309407 RepID=A0ABQ2FPU1_9DEIO|nr:Ig-like domain-containing protein [Deinococcus radiotolerans]GGL14776.1 hypothetical protein GCM10010844_37000 [Deinococcus radiotolerans]